MGDRVSNKTLSDLIAGTERSDPYKGFARAAIGQGLGMGWGDEAEAFLRSKLGEGDYEKNLAQIQKEYGLYSKEHPVMSTAGEFGGGFIPGAAAMLVPGMQTVGAGQMQRSTAGALARLAAMGATTGAVSGAGSAKEGERASGAVSGGAMGGVLGLAIPVGIRSGKGAYNWLRDRLLPTEALVEKRAAEKLTKAMQEGSMSPSDIEAKIKRDRSMNVPSTVANTDEAIAGLAEAVAQRTGKGSRTIETKLNQQKMGSRERVNQQVVKGLNPKNYYEELNDLKQSLKTKASPIYDEAYLHGEVTSPEVLKFLKRPQFIAGMKEAEHLLEAEGRKMPTVKMIDPITGKEVERVSPTVEVLDQVKRGLDALIEKETDAVTGKMTSKGRVYSNSKNEFLNALDSEVPKYAEARAVYKGDAELMDALRTGINDFGKLDHEQVVAKIAKMSGGEKEAFRTGVARDLYSKIMNPSNNFNSAQRIIGSPEMQAKLQPLFDNPAQFKLFKAAMERESQLFHQSNKILGGSPTARRQQGREQLEQTSGVGDAIATAVTGGFWNGVTGLATKAIRSGQMTEKVADKLGDMLMSKDPHEVAAVVKMLEEFAVKAKPAAVKASGLEAGATTGATAAIFPAPPVQGERPNIEKDLGEPSGEMFPGQKPDIEADIEADLAAELK